MSPIDRQQERAQRERLERVVNGLTDEQLGASVGGGWTVSVVLAHMAFWDRRVVAQLQKWQREGRGPGPQDNIAGDVINDASVQQWRLIPPRAAAAEAVEAAEAADQALQQADPKVIEEVLTHDGPFGLPRAVHRAEHLDQIERAFG